MVSIFTRLLSHLFPDLELILRRAGVNQEPETYLKKASFVGFLFAVLFSALSIGVALKEGFSIYIAIFVFLVIYFLGVFIVILLPGQKVKQRRREAESDILYSGRYLLLKLESGSPLLNALIDVSNLDTKSSKFFKEIVSDVFLGTPIEDAIDTAIKYGVSPAFTKILEEIKTSLRTGSDIEKALRTTLSDITKLHVIEIKAYGKKLSPLSMFYMIMGTILPSIGSAMLVVASGFLPGFLNEIDFKILATLAFIVFLIQVFFILFFKAIKPAVMT